MPIWLPNLSRNFYHFNIKNNTLTKRQFKNLSLAINIETWNLSTSTVVREIHVSNLCRTPLLRRGTLSTPQIKTTKVTAVGINEKSVLRPGKPKKHSLSPPRFQNKRNERNPKTSLRTVSYVSAHNWVFLINGTRLNTSLHGTGSKKSLERNTSRSENTRRQAV